MANSTTGQRRGPRPMEPELAAALIREHQLEHAPPMVVTPPSVAFAVWSLGWWCARALLGVTAVVSFVVLVGGSIALGLCIGCALAFVAAFAPDNQEDSDGESEDHT